MPDIGLGFRVKSGWAIAVALAGPAASPTPLARRIVDLSDPRVAETRQPYHAGFGEAQEDSREIARLVKIIERCGNRSIAELLSEIVRRPGPTNPAEQGGSKKQDPSYICRRACLVVGSVIDPANVGNPHIRAHANEGRLFRLVVEHALKEHGIDCTIVIEKQLAETAGRTLRRSSSAIKATIDEVGRRLGKPWRADEKAAATAAWLALV